MQDQTLSGTRVLFERRCGYCEACRLTYRQQWAARIQLEASCHPVSSFVTLTYSQDYLPDPPELKPDHLSEFVKVLRERLRRRGYPDIRFFGVGEYGSRTLRPHYHLVIFGLDPISCAEQVLQAWGRGHVQVAPMSPARASYVAKYVCKDVSGDEKIPDGWQREFARMSRRPGIGSLYVAKVADAVNKANDKQLSRGYPAITNLIGGSMRIGPVYYPVARYLRDKTKELVKVGHMKELTAALERERRTRSKKIDRSIKADKHRRARAGQVREKIKKSQGVL